MISPSSDKKERICTTIITACEMWRLDDIKREFLIADCETIPGNLLRDGWLKLSVYVPEKLEQRWRELQ